jgi:hypothetical protein
MNKYEFILCELHHPVIHGKTEESDANIETYYMVTEKFNINDFDDFDDINDSINMHRRIYYLYLCNRHLIFQLNVHPTIRNYIKIVSNKQYIKPEIAECIILSTGETIAILKTFWIRIIQKVWKNVLKKRKEYIIYMRNNNNLHLRELGRLHIRLPGMKGMLKNINIKKNKLS